MAIQSVSIVWAMRVARIFEQYKMSVTSWGRSAAYNALVGGSVDPPSRHTTWDAMDGATVSRDNAVECFSLLRAERLGYGYVKKSGKKKGETIWQIHIQRQKPRKA